MNTTKILESEISELKISSLPSRPTAPASFGGKGYTAKDMKEAFDRLPLFIIEKFNALIDDISSEGEGAVSSSIKTGIYKDHTLRDLFEDILSGAISTYLSLGEEALGDFYRRADNELDTLRAAVSTTTTGFIETLKPTSSLVTPEHGRIYRFGSMKSLTVIPPARVSDEYFSEISFDSPAIPCELSIRGTVRLSGDDVADGELMPKPDRHYTVFLWYDGELQGVVRGIDNA